MSTSTWTMVVGAVAGLVLAVFGAWVLISGRAPSMTAKSFRNTRDAGLYHLLFGLALALVVIGTGLDRSLVTVTTTLLAVVMVGVAMVRYRPRSHRPQNAQADHSPTTAATDSVPGTPHHAEPGHPRPDRVADTSEAGGSKV